MARTSALALLCLFTLGCDGPQRYDGDVLAPGDTFRVEITEIGAGSGQTESTQVKVAPDGTAIVPPFGRFDVGGKTMGQASRMISREAERRRGYRRYLVVLKR